MPSAAEIKKTADDAKKLAEESKPGSGLDAFTTELLGSDHAKEMLGEIKLPAEKKGAKKPAPKAAVAAVEAEETELTEDEQAEADRLAAEEAAKAKVVTVPPPAPPDYAKIAEAAATGTATAIEAARTAEKKAAAATDPNALPEVTALPKEHQRIVETLKQMEQENPAEYKGVSEKYRKSIQDLTKYADEWRKKNPGKEFDEDDEEHKEFYKSVDVEWDDDDFTDARARIMANKIVAEKTAPQDAQLLEMKKKAQIVELQPAIAKERIDTAQTFFAAAGEEYKDIVKPDGTLNTEKITELQETDPITVQALFTSAQNAEIVAAEMLLLARGAVAPNVKDNRLHADINTFAMEQEKRILAQPPEKQLDAGKRPFLPAGQYWKLPEAQRKAYWTFNHRDLSVIWSKQSARQAIEFAKKENERIEQIAEKKGYKRDGAKPDTSTATPAVQQRQQAAGANRNAIAGNGKPKSPSVGGEPGMAGARKGAQVKPETAEKTFEERYLGRS